MALLEMFRFTTKVPSQTRPQATCSYPNNLRKLDKWPVTRYMWYLRHPSSHVSLPTKIRLPWWDGNLLHCSIPWCPVGNHVGHEHEEIGVVTHMSGLKCTKLKILCLFSVSSPAETTQYKNCKIKLHIRSLPWKLVKVCLLSMWMQTNSTKMCLLMTW